MAREKLKLFQIKILARVLHLPSYYFRSTESGLEYQIEFQNLAKVQAKTVAENWDSKAPSVGTLLAYLETTA